MYVQCLNILFFPAISAFIVVSVLHLIRCKQEKEGLADITKFMLMPALALVFLSSVIGVGSFSWLNLLILGALVFSFLGDWSLIFDIEKRFFIFGVLFFAVAHICYVIYSTSLIYRFTETDAINFLFIVASIVFVVFVLLFIFAFLQIRKFLKGLKGIYIVYSFVIITMSSSFISLALISPNLATILVAIGSIAFLISDYILSVHCFIGGIRKPRFFIMLSYILAQALIVIGSMGIPA